MLERVRSLANFMRDKPPGEKFVLMLGAGASLSSGVPTTRAIVEDLVKKYAVPPAGSPLDDAFDQLWRESSPKNRLLMLDPYLRKTPSEGYRCLADLIRRGYIDTIITFNYDGLLERALDEAGFRDYKVIIRGETSDEALKTLVHAREPRVKVLKLHGSLKSANYFLFAREEMVNYPRPLEAIVEELTSRDVIVCGYAFNDHCVLRAFSTAPDAGDIYFINPSGAVDSIKALLAGRRSQNKVISGEFGRFDRFFTELKQRIDRPEVAPAPEPRRNLFKFLDHYQEEDRAWFQGRRLLTRRLVDRIERLETATLYLYGHPKVGKTSLVRAGLIPHLDPASYDCVYLRCTPDVVPQLRAEVLKRCTPAADALDFDALLDSVARENPKRLIIFLDQFERVCRAAEIDDQRRKGVLDMLATLADRAGARLSLVLVAVYEVAFWKLLAETKGRITSGEEIRPLPPPQVAGILRRAARHGSVQLDRALLEALVGEYRQTVERPADKHRFTLMDVQTVCYYLARGYKLPHQVVYGDLPAGLRAVLDSTHEDKGILDLLDDLPSEERPLIRSFLKVLCAPDADTRKIIEFIKNHFPEIKKDRFPEPIV